MKAITIATILAVVSTPALARKADHPRHAKHRHAHVVATDAQTPFGSWPTAMSAGWNAQARAPRVARNAAPGQGTYSAMVARHAAANGVPASLVHRVIMRESRYNPRAVSKGNYGMMQIKLGTARAMGYTGTAAGLLDPETNMTYAVKYLAGAYKVAGGSESGAVANYARGYYYRPNAVACRPMRRRHAGVCDAADCCHADVGTGAFLAAHRTRQLRILRPDAIGPPRGVLSAFVSNTGGALRPLSGGGGTPPALRRRSSMKNRRRLRAAGSVFQSQSFSARRPPAAPPSAFPSRPRGSSPPSAPSRRRAPRSGARARATRRTPRPAPRA